MKGTKLFTASAALAAILTAGAHAQTTEAKAKDPNSGGNNSEKASETCGDERDPKHTEILHFRIQTNGGGSFVSVPRNVIEQDQTHIYIENNNPLLFVPEVTLWTANTPEQPLLRFAGVSPSLIEPFATKAAQASDDAIAKGAKTAKEAAKAGVNSESPNARFNITMSESPATPNNDPHFSKELAQALSETEQEWSRLQDALRSLPKTPDLNPPLREFGTRVRETQDRLIQAQKVMPPVRRSIEDLKNILGNPDQIRDGARAARDAVNKILAASATARASVLVLTGFHKSRLELLAGAGTDTQKERREFSLKLIEAAESAIPGLDKIDSAAKDTLSKVNTATEAIIDALGIAYRAILEHPTCSLVPRIEPGKDVFVEIKVKRVDSYKFAAAEATDTRNSAMLTSIRSVLATGNSGGAGTAAAGESSGGAGSKDDGKESNGLTEIFMDRQHYSILSPTHISVTVGATVSGLANPTFDFRAASESGKIIVYRKADAHLQVRPVVHLGLYPRPRYLFAEDDNGDRPNETVPKRDWWPYPTIGFALTEPTDNFFAGGGWDIYHGITINGGLHLGRVKRLLPGYSEEVAFAKPDNFKVDDIVETRWRPGWYGSIAIDARTLLKALGGLGGTGK